MESDGGNEGAKPELVVFKFKRDADTSNNVDTLMFAKRHKMVRTGNTIETLTSQMNRVSVDESVICLKRFDEWKVEPSLSNLVFRSRDLSLQKRRELRNELISGLRSRNFPQSIKVCDLDRDWEVYAPSKSKKSLMEVEQQHDYYFLQRDVVSEDHKYEYIDPPAQVADFIGESENEDNDSQDSEDSNRESNPDNDYPEEDYDFDEEELQDNYGEYNYYEGGEEDGDEEDSS